jgi:hypothetical protein
MTSIGGTIFTPPRDGDGERIYPGIPDRLVCGYEYSIAVRVQEEIKNTKNLNYRVLYDRAKAIAKDRVGRITCPANCGPVLSWEVARAWDNEFDGNPLVAYAVVEFVVLCPQKKEENRSLKAPGANDFAQPKHEPVGHVFEDAVEFIKTEQVTPVAIACVVGLPNWIGYTFEYREYDYDCSDHKKGDAPFRRRAQSRARILAAQCFTCPPPCTFRVRTTTSGSTCLDDYVVVPVKVEVACA